MSTSPFHCRLSITDVLVFLSPFLLFAPILLSGQALFWGVPSLQFVPWRFYAWVTLRSGYLPLWNPLLGMGAPLIANYQSALFYPPHWVYLLLGEIGGVAAMAWGQALLVAFHLGWAGLGMARLGRELKLNDLGQVVAGLAYSLSGYLVARASFLSINATVAWLPWILMEVVRLAGLVKPRWPLMRLAVYLALQWLAGHAQMSWYTLLLAGVWATYWGWNGGMENRQADEESSRKSYARWLACSPLFLRGFFGRIKGVLRTWFWLFLACLIAWALSAVQLLPTFEYLWQSQRANEVGLDIALNYSFWPWRFFGFFAPNFFGNPAWGDYWGYGNFWEDAVYIGLLPLCLAITTIVASIRCLVFRRKNSVPSLNGPIIFLTLLLLPAFLLALGKNTPFYLWLYYHVPTFDMFQAPARWMIWAVFALALLGGIGCQTWRRPSGRSLYWIRLAATAAFALMLGSGLGWLLWRDVTDGVHLSTMTRAIALSGLLAMGVGLLTLIAPHSGKSQPALVFSRSSWWSWMVILWLLLDLFIASWGLNPSIDLSFYRLSTSHHRSLQRDDLRNNFSSGRIFISAEVENELKYGRFFRFNSFQPEKDWSDLRTTMLPNLNLLEGVAVTANFDPLTPGRYARWMQEVNAAGEKQEVMLDLMAVNVVGRANANSPGGIEYVIRNKADRLRWFPCARVASSPDEALFLTLHQALPLETVILEDKSAILDRHCFSFYQNGDEKLAILAESPNSIMIQVDSDTPGWLFLADVWYPGWQAKLDGERVSLLRADYLFRAVFVPAGKHEVVMEYRPIWFYLGGGVSLLAWLWLAISYARGWVDVRSGKICENSH